MWLLPISILVVTTLLAIPLSKYLSWIMDGKYRPWGPFRWIESTLNSGPQNWKQYTGALLLFNTVLFVFGFIVLSLQPFFPLNDLGRGMLAPSTIFHSVVSFLSNKLLPISLDRFLRSYCHYQSFAKRSQHGKLLRRYLAGGNVHVPARFLCACLDFLATRRPYDFCERTSRFYAGTRGDGYGRQRPA